jgi:hypothetical protein
VTLPTWFEANPPFSTCGGGGRLPDRRRSWVIDPPAFEVGRPSVKCEVHAARTPPSIYLVDQCSLALESLLPLDLAVE